MSDYIILVVRMQCNTMNSQLLYPGSPYSPRPLILFSYNFREERISILMASVDIEIEHENINMNKMLPLINDEGQ